MRLADAIGTDSHKPGPPCSVRLALAAVNDDELLADLDDWFHGRGAHYTTADIHKILKGFDPAVKYQTVGRHRRATLGYGDTCGCPPDIAAPTWRSA